MILAAPVFAQDPEVELQRAIQKETINGDLKTAIEDYRGIAAKAGVPRAVAAKALIRMADAYRRLGDAEARKVYERIVKEFGDQKDAVAEARLHLGAVASRPSGTEMSRRLVWRGAPDASGSISDDGRFLSMTDWETGDLALRDLAKGVTRRLTNTGGYEVSGGDEALYPLVSPDGRVVVFGWFDGTARKTDLRAVTVAADAPKSRVLHDGGAGSYIRPLAWMPDSRRVVAMRGSQTDRTDLEFVMVDVSEAAVVRPMQRIGGQPRQLSVSPDGRYLAYDLPGMGRSERDLAILPVDLSRPAVIIRHPANDWNGVWTRDGSHLLFQSDRTSVNALWALRVADGRPSGEPQLLARELGGELFGTGRDGTLFYSVFVGDRRNVMMADVDANLKLASVPRAINDRVVDGAVTGAWSPDGTQVAYYAAPGVPPNTGGQKIVIRSVGTGQERELKAPILRGGGRTPSLQWFPDGRSLLVMGAEPEKAQGVGYYRLSLESGQSELLLRPAGPGPNRDQVQLSPDGKALVFIEAGKETRNLTRYDLETRQTKVLKKGWFGSVALSSDGGQIVYIGHEGANTLEGSVLAVLPFDGGAERILARGDFNLGSTSMGTLGTSGDAVLYVLAGPSPESHQLWTVPLGGGPPRTTGIVVNGTIKQPRLSPDGKRILYTTNQRAPMEIWALDNYLPAASGK
jgi:Tol biopolymer transport system component